MRYLFTDGINSIIHTVFGVLSYANPLIAPFFVFYQLVFLSGWNTVIDLTEFIIGYSTLSIFLRRTVHQAQLYVS